MNSNATEESSFNLPEPNTGGVDKLLPINNPEVVGANLAGEMPQQAELPQATAPPLTPLPVSSQTSIQDTPYDDSLSIISDADTSAPSEATSDLIEKEWVVRAKAIVQQTRSDPHLQTEQLSKFKAEYMKKRYNKDLKVDEN